TTRMPRCGSGSVPIAIGWKCTNCRRTHRSSIPRSAFGNTRARPELTTGTSQPPRNWSAPCHGSSERCNSILNRSDPICFLFADRDVPLLMRGCIVFSEPQLRQQETTFDIQMLQSDNRAESLKTRGPVRRVQPSRRELRLRLGIMRSSMVLFKGLPIYSMLLIGLLPVARADIYTYSYQGNPFNYFYNETCPPTCGITASFTINQPLPANTLPYNGFSNYWVLPDSFTVTD